MNYPYSDQEIEFYTEKQEETSKEIEQSYDSYNVYLNMLGDEVNDTSISN